jgi:hypothetical protein
MGSAFAILGAIMLWRNRDLGAVLAGALGALFVVGALAVPTRLGPVERAWMRLAHAISKVTTPILMGIVYYVTVAPIGLVMRMLGRNPLVHRPLEGSFWIARPPETDKAGSMRRQF